MGYCSPRVLGFPAGFRTKPICFEAPSFNEALQQVAKVGADSSPWSFGVLFVDGSDIRRKKKQLRLVVDIHVYPIIYKVLYIHPRWLAGVFPSYSFKCILSNHEDLEDGILNSP